MMFLRAYKHMKEGYIARCKHSYYCLYEDYLCRVRKKAWYIEGVATVTGDIFATDNWELLDIKPIIRRNGYGFYSGEI